MKPLVPALLLSVLSLPGAARAQYQNGAVQWTSPLGAASSNETKVHLQWDASTRKWTSQEGNCLEFGFVSDVLPTWDTLSIPDRSFCAEDPYPSPDQFRKAYQELRSHVIGRKDVPWQSEDSGPDAWVRGLWQGTLPNKLGAAEYWSDTEFARVIKLGDDSDAGIAWTARDDNSRGARVDVYRAYMNHQSNGIDRLDAIRYTFQVDREGNLEFVKRTSEETDPDKVINWDPGWGWSPEDQNNAVVILRWHQLVDVLNRAAAAKEARNP